MKKGEGIQKQIEDAGATTYTSNNFTKDAFISLIDALEKNYNAKEDVKWRNIPKPHEVEQMVDGTYMFNGGMYSKAFLLELSKAIHGA